MGWQKGRCGVRIPLARAQSAFPLTWTGVRDPVCADMLASESRPEPLAVTVFGMTGTPRSHRLVLVLPRAVA